MVAVIYLATSAIERFQKSRGQEKFRILRPPGLTQSMELIRARSGHGGRNDAPTRLMVALTVPM